MALHPDDVQNSKTFADIIMREFIQQTCDAKPRAKLDFSGAANTIAVISGMLKERNSNQPPDGVSCRLAQGCQ